MRTVAFLMVGCLPLVQGQSLDVNPLSIDRGAAGIWQALKKLQTRASLIMITAHPDDEDGGMLTYEARGKGARVALLTLNRGESGANVMSPDFFDALGLVRTEELLAADRYYDVDQYFTRVVNFGFSKTKEETYDSWSHDRLLADAVRVIRMTRPLVVTSVFIGGPSDGHGNHQAAGQTAQEVFQAAGDPNAFPEQIREGLRPWRPMKMYARVPFARVTDKGIYDYATHHWAPAQVFDYIHNQSLPWGIAANVKVPEGEVDPVIGTGYVQISREGLGFQKSQNGGTSIPASGKLMSAYHRFGSVVQAADNEESFFDGIDTSLVGIGELAPGASFLKPELTHIQALVDQASGTFRAERPADVAPVIASGLKATENLIQQVSGSSLAESNKYDVLHELRLKREQFNTALRRVLGITILANVAPERPPDARMAEFMGTPQSFALAIPGQQFWVNVHVNNPTATVVDIQEITLRTPEREKWGVQAESPASGTLAANTPANVRFRVNVPQDAQATRPYFSRPDVERGWYDIQDERYINRPFAPYPLSAHVALQYQGSPIEMDQVVQTVKRVTGAGTVYEPLAVAPAISVAVEPGAGIVPIGAQSFNLVANVHSNVKGAAKGTLHLDLPGGWRSEPAIANFATMKDGDEQRISFKVMPAQVRDRRYTIAAVANEGGREYREGYRTTGYEGLRPYYLYRLAEYRGAGVDVKVAPGLNVGYIRGSGDEVPESLDSLGIKVHFLTASDLAAGDLAKYDVILVGVRAYAVRDDLKTNNAHLLDYVNQGGVVMVQYNTPEFDHNYGPYPYKMTNDPEEVTDEASKVEILAAANPVFNWPNKITQADFQGWVAERGSKFMASWDSHYEPLLETHDPGQDLQKGGLLYAKYGKGLYLYNAYAFYRQLPEGVPGAYRIFANMLSLPRNPRVKEASN